MAEPVPADQPRLEAHLSNQLHLHHRDQAGEPAVVSLADAAVQELAVVVEGPDALVAGGAVLGGLEGLVSAESAEMDRVLGGVRGVTLASLNDVHVSTTTKSPLYVTLTMLVSFTPVD